MTFQTIYLVDAIRFLPPLILLLGPLRHVAGRPEHDGDTRLARRATARCSARPGIATLELLSFVGSFVAYAQLNTGMPAFARVVGEVSTRDWASPSRPTRW